MYQISNTVSVPFLFGFWTLKSYGPKVSAPFLFGFWTLRSYGPKKGAARAKLSTSSSPSAPQNKEYPTPPCLSKNFVLIIINNICVVHQ